MSAETAGGPHARFDLDGVLVDVPHDLNWYGRFTKTHFLPTFDFLRGRDDPRYRRLLFPPRRLIEGAGDFVAGVHEGGVAVDGIVSARFSWLERSARKTVKRAGVSHIIPAGNVTVVSDDAGKAREFVTGMTPDEVNALVEDKPYKVGPHIVEELGKGEAAESWHDVVIGVPDDPRATERIRRLGATLREGRNPERGPGNGLERIRNLGHSLDVVGPNFNMMVVPLPSFTHPHAGEQFAGMLHNFPPS